MLRSLPLAANKPLRGRVRRPTTSAIMFVMFACFARRQFSSSLSAGFKPGARSLRKRARRLSAARLLASGAGLSRFRLSQVVFSTASNFKIRFISLRRVSTPRQFCREGPHPFPRLAVVAPQGGGVRKRLSASSGLRSRVFSLRSQTAFDRASAPAVSLFGVSSGFAFKVFLPHLDGFPSGEAAARPARRRFRGDEPTALFRSKGRFTHRSKRTFTRRSVCALTGVFSNIYGNITRRSKRSFSRLRPSSSPEA